MTEVSLNLTEISLTLIEVFPCFFLSCKANARVKLIKTGHGPHSSTLVVICVARLLFLLFCVLFVCKCVLPPGDNPIAVNKHINNIISINKTIYLKQTMSLRHALLQLFSIYSLCYMYCFFDREICFELLHQHFPQYSYVCVCVCVCAQYGCFLQFLNFAPSPLSCSPLLLTVSLLLSHSTCAEFLFEVFIF